MSVRWSINTVYGDTISASIQASGGSSFHVAPSSSSDSSDSSVVTLGPEGEDSGMTTYGGAFGDTGGNGDQPSSENNGDTATLPADFTGESSWTASASITVFTSGSFSLSSTPSLIAGGVSREISSSGSNGQGVSAQSSESFSSSSSSGDLADPGACYTCSTGAPPTQSEVDSAYDSVRPQMDASSEEGAQPFDPVGQTEGAGHSASSSGTSSGGVSGGLNSGWSINATLDTILGNSRFSRLNGQFSNRMSGSNFGAGTEKSDFRYVPGSESWPIPNGTTSSSFVYADGYFAGGSTALAVVSVVNSYLGLSPVGEVQIDDSGEGGDVEINEAGKGFGVTFLTATYSDQQGFTRKDYPAHKQHLAVP